MKTFTLLGAGAMLICALTACSGETTPDAGSGQAPPKSELTEEPSDDVQPDVSYGTVEELRDAAVESGYDCRNWRNANYGRLSAESGNCTGNDVFTTYASDGDLQKQLANEKEGERFLRSLDLEPPSFLVGPNWIIKNQDRDKLIEIEEEMGGTLVTPGQ